MSKDADTYRRELMPKLTNTADPELRELVEDLLTYTKQLEIEKKRLKGPSKNKYLGVYRGSDRVRTLEADIRRALGRQPAGGHGAFNFGPALDDLLQYAKSLHVSL